MLRLFHTTHTMRSALRKLGHLASSAAILSGLCVLTISHAAFYRGGGIDAGINAATAINGISTVTPKNIIITITNQISSYAMLLAITVIVIAGFYLVLGLGGESSRTAKKIIIYTAVGIIIISIASDIVDVMRGIPSGNDVLAFRTDVRTIINTTLNYVALVLLVVIFIAGVILLTSGGDEGRRDTAKKIIIYAIIGTLVIVFAKAIANFILDITP